MVEVAQVVEVHPLQELTVVTVVELVEDLVELVDQEIPLLLVLHKDKMVDLLLQVMHPHP